MPFGTFSEPDVNRTYQKITPPPATSKYYAHSSNGNTRSARALSPSSGRSSDARRNRFDANPSNDRNLRMNRRIHRDYENSSPSHSEREYESRSNYRRVDFGYANSALSEGGDYRPNYRSDYDSRSRSNRSFDSRVRDRDERGYSSRPIETFPEPQYLEPEEPKPSFQVPQQQPEIQEVYYNLGYKTPSLSSQKSLLERRESVWSNFDTQRYCYGCFSSRGGCIRGICFILILIIGGIVAAGIYFFPKAPTVSVNNPFAGGNAPALGGLKVSAADPLIALQSASPSNPLSFTLPIPINVDVFSPNKITFALKDLTVSAGIMDPDGGDFIVGDPIGTGSTGRLEFPSFKTTTFTLPILVNFTMTSPISALTSNLQLMTLIRSCSPELAPGLPPVAQPNTIKLRIKLDFSSLLVDWTGFVPSFNKDLSFACPPATKDLVGLLKSGGAGLGSIGLGGGQAPVQKTPGATKVKMLSAKVLLNKVDYLFGSSVVLSALDSQKRALKKLYIKKEVEIINAETERNAQNIAIQRANQLSLPVEKIPSHRMNKLSENRPHQGLILMAAPIELRQIESLSSFDIDTDSYIIKTFSNQVIERYIHSSRRPFPFWLVLDKIVDPQNLGAILRTAYFFGIDGVCISTRESSPPTPIVSKASAGALEVMDLYETNSLQVFLQKSALNGWTIYGTDLNAHKDKLRYIDPAFEIPSLLQSPTILVLGNEGKGLRKSVSNLCDLHLILSRYQQHKTNLSYQIDSLNVSVAAGIIIHKILDS